MSAQEYETTVKVLRRTQVADGVLGFDLGLPDGSDLPIWAPGAHIDFLLGGDLIRQYSLCGDPENRRIWQVGVLVEPESRGGSRFIDQKLHEGSEIRVRGPRNHFELVPARSYRFIAGGIGITPILPMINAAKASGADWKLLYGGRRRSSMSFLDRLEGDGGNVGIHPQDESGLLDLVGYLAAVPTGTAVYCCGPEPLLKALEDQFGAKLGSDLHIERFTPREQPPASTNMAFEVYLEMSDMTLQIPPDRSILEVLQDADVDVLCSCSEGTCGTCVTPVIEGIPDHRDSVLNERQRAKNDQMMVCVSRSKTPRLVLDL